MPNNSEPKSRSLVQSSTETSAETSQNDERYFDNTLSEGDSYEALRRVSSGGAHFQFKSEKSWTLTDLPVNSRFQVKISSMSQNFSNIPFSDRWNLYSESYFKQIQNDTYAPENYFRSDDCISLESSEDSYKPALENDREITSFSKKLDEFDAEWAELSQSPVIAGRETISTSSTTTSTEKSINDDITASKLSKMNINQETFDQKSKSAESSKHNLEDWLDSILDD